MKENKQHKKMVSRTLDTKQCTSNLGFVDNRSQSIIRNIINNPTVQKQHKTENCKHNRYAILQNNSPVIQRVLYLRGISNSTVDYEILYLLQYDFFLNKKYIFPYFYKYMGMIGPVTRYNPGQKNYYSPIGYILDIKNEDKIFMNYYKDGNTGDLTFNHFANVGSQVNNFYSIIEKIFKNVDSNEFLNDYIKLAVNKKSSPSDIALGNKLANELANELKKMKQKYADKLQDVMEDPGFLLNLELLFMQIINLEKSGKISIEKHNKSLMAVCLELFYYSHNGALGRGFNPPGLKEFEALYKGDNNLAKGNYTETRAIIDLVDVIGVFYNINNNEYDKKGWNFPITDEEVNLLTEEMLNNENFNYETSPDLISENNRVRKAIFDAKLEKKISSNNLYFINEKGLLINKMTNSELKQSFN